MLNHFLIIAVTMLILISSSAHAESMITGSTSTITTEIYNTYREFDGLFAGTRVDTNETKYSNSTTTDTRYSASNVGTVNTNAGKSWCYENGQPDNWDWSYSVTNRIEMLPYIYSVNNTQYQMTVPKGYFSAGKNTYTESLLSGKI